MVGLVVISRCCFSLGLKDGMAEIDLKGMKKVNVVTSKRSNNR